MWEVQSESLSRAQAAHQRRVPAAEKHLRRAILLDPSDPSPWRERARFYRSLGARQQHAALHAQHEAVLPAPLPG